MPGEPIPRILLSREEAAHALGLSLAGFNRHVAPHVPVVRLGQRRLYPIDGLKRWADARASTIEP